MLKVIFGAKVILCIQICKYLYINFAILYAKRYFCKVDFAKYDKIH